MKIKSKKYYLLISVVMLFCSFTTEINHSCNNSDNQADTIRINKDEDYIFLCEIRDSVRNVLKLKNKKLELKQNDTINALAQEINKVLNIKSNNEYEYPILFVLNGVPISKNCNDVILNILSIKSIVFLDNPIGCSSSYAVLITTVNPENFVNLVKNNENKIKKNVIEKIAENINNFGGFDSGFRFYRK